MKIKMIKTERGASDGIHVEVYRAGESYDVSDTLGKIFTETLKVASVVGETLIEEKKAPEPENKSMKSAPVDKEVEHEEVNLRETDPNKLRKGNRK